MLKVQIDESYYIQYDRCRFYGEIARRHGSTAHSLYKLLTLQEFLVKLFEVKRYK